MSNVSGSTSELGEIVYQNIAFSFLFSVLFLDFLSSLTPTSDISVSLIEKPIIRVNIDFSVDNPLEGVIVGAKSLTFTVFNWSIQYKWKRGIEEERAEERRRERDEERSERRREDRSKEV